jgi:hypothetical protein
MDPTLASYQRIYLQLKRGDPGKLKMVFSRLQPTGGAMVALLSRGSILRDGMEVQLVTDATADPALRGPAGKDGTNGVDGASAYQIARAGGYGGTQTAWLASLVGSTGKDGTDGKAGADGLSAYQVARSAGYGGTQTQWLSTLVGAAGKDGLNGKDGVKGDTGSPGATLLGPLTIAETAQLVAISAGARRVTVTTPVAWGVAPGQNLLLFPASLPSGAFATHDVIATAPNTLSIGLTTPAITLLSSYSIPCRLVRINT